jgi:uncharacterized membrane protein
MTPALVGGILLIIGAFFMYRGLAMYSILTYFLADIAWAVMSYQNKDYIGLLFVIIGMLLGFGVFLKMHTGFFVKNLHTKTERIKDD